MAKYDITQQEFSERLSYDPITGYIIWIAKGNSKKVIIGNRAGSVSPYGHRVIRWNGLLFPEHLVIWRLHYGVWPVGYIDHINHNEQDNRLINLRDVPKCVNNRNQSKRSNNTTGHPGVWINKLNSRKKFMSEVTFEGKRVHLQAHYSIEEAINRRKEVLKEYGFHPNHGIDKPIN